MATNNYVTGVDAVQAAFRRLSRQSAAEIEKALILGGNDIVDAAETLAPEDQGDLVNDIQASPVTQTTRGVAVDVTAGNTRQTADAAFRSEFGRTATPDGHPGHAAQPFLMPAYWAKRRRVRSRVARALRKVAKGLARRGK